MENEADFNGLPSTQMVEMQLRRRASQISALADLLPAIGRLDEAKRHFIEVGEIYYHYIFQNNFYVKPFMRIKTNHIMH